jgi:putative ABC transport system ATP-binding protein
VPGASKNLIELRSVSKIYQTYSAPVRALTEVSVSIDRGEFVAVWGPSGSGKSTMCNLIGLLDVPTAGEVDFAGTDAARLVDDDRSELRNRSIGFVFQQFNLVPVLSALENVMLPLQIRGVARAECRDRAQALLARVGLATHVAHRPDKLSGGQQQRVALARALVGEPQLVLADEPTANLDTQTAHSIIELMQSLNAEKNTTFLFCTHDQRLLDAVQRRIHLTDGRIVEDRHA